MGTTALGGWYQRGEVCTPALMPCARNRPGILGNSPFRGWILAIILNKQQEQEFLCSESCVGCLSILQHNLPQLPGVFYGQSYNSTTAAPPRKACRMSSCVLNNTQISSEQHCPGKCWFCAFASLGAVSTEHKCHICQAHTQYMCHRQLRQEWLGLFKNMSQAQNINKSLTADTCLAPSCPKSPRASIKASFSV